MDSVVAWLWQVLQVLWRIDAVLMVIAYAGGLAYVIANASADFRRRYG